MDPRLLGREPDPDAPLLTVPSHLVLETNCRGRDFFVGDLHGQGRMLKRLLGHVGFRPGRDRLIGVGDWLDRGPDSAKMLEAFARGQLYSVLGNHEARYIVGDGRPFDDEPHYQREQSLPGADHDRYVTIARRMPLTIEVPLADGRRIGVVHAEVPQREWARGCKVIPRNRHARRASDDEDAGIALHGRECVRYLAAELRPLLPPIIDGIDLVVSGHTNLVQGRVWRYGNQIGLESLAFHPRGAMTLFEPLADYYWSIRNHALGMPTKVAAQAAPIDLSAIFALH